MWSIVPRGQAHRRTILWQLDEQCTRYLCAMTQVLSSRTPRWAAMHGPLPSPRRPLHTPPWRADILHRSCRLKGNVLTPSSVRLTQHAARRRQLLDRHARLGSQPATSNFIIIYNQGRARSTEIPDILQIFCGRGMPRCQIRCTCTKSEYISSYKTLINAYIYKANCSGVISYTRIRINRDEHY